MRIAFVGNFSVPYSTESHVAWTWERLGHEVIRLQENKVTSDDALGACNGIQLFSWTHTHNWSLSGSITGDEMLRKIREGGTKSFTQHLDYYYGLDTWDHRWSLVGQHASWKVDYVFLTDGGHDAEFRTKGVNVHWLPPAVVEYGCFKGTPQAGLAADVAFLGSVSYHPEYPFRPKLVAALQERYGTRFRLFQGYRERALNDLCASVKVIVGDHCFAGTPKYWSDRLPELCGRGGFLLYPETEGMTIPTATYRPQDLNDLFAKIDYYLANEGEREAIRERAFAHVKVHDTYAIRLKKILEIVGVT